MLRSGEKKPHFHKRALLFVDNSGADVVLGMLPLAQELLRRGTEVVLVGKSLPAPNDVNAMELLQIIAEVAKHCDIIRRAAEAGGLLVDAMNFQDISKVNSSSVPLMVVENGCACPCIYLKQVSAAAAKDADLIILEGMGRALHTNYNARFKCDALKITREPIKPRRPPPSPRLRPPPPPRHPPPPRLPPPPLSVYDHTQVVHSWPPTYCLTADCKPVLEKMFYLHDLWVNSTGHTMDNGRGTPLDLITFEHIVKKQTVKNFRIVWPTLHPQNPPEKHWAWEWNTHGCCADNDYEKYFTQAIYLEKMFYITLAFKRGEIIPHSKVLYTKLKIKNTV